MLRPPVWNVSPQRYDTWPRKFCCSRRGRGTQHKASLRHLGCIGCAKIHPRPPECPKTILWPRRTQLLLCLNFYSVEAVWTSPRYGFLLFCHRLATRNVGTSTRQNHPLWRRHLNPCVPFSFADANTLGKRPYIAQLSWKSIFGWWCLSFCFFLRSLKPFFPTDAA